MKIAYLSYNLMHSIANGGVGRKIRSTIQAWNEAGHTARWFLTTSAEVSGENITAFRFGLGQRGLRREIDRSRQLGHMLQAVADFQPDVVYMRSGIYTYPLHRLFRIAPVVQELNTLDVIEYRMRGIFHFGVHRLTRDYVYGHAAGFLAVSHEIGEHPSNTRYGKPIQVLTNGIDLRQYEPLPAPHNPAPRLAYIGVPDNPWQGLDKLFWLAEACPDFEFDLIGSAPEHFVGQSVPSNVHLHGFLDRSAYQPILARADVGIGTLALHRKGMEEASPLKVREYLAYGIPVLLAYDDTDLRSCGLEFIQKIPNTEDNLRTHLSDIREFALGMQGKRVDRKAIFPLLDKCSKEQIRLDFLSHIAANGKGKLA
ncbi:MAG: glycosyltransferase [Anaerolineaceae bacterium]|nr:glycosyltransferase [Anaerolineaceae bacterium]